MNWSIGRVSCWCLWLLLRNACWPNFLVQIPSSRCRCTALCRWLCCSWRFYTSSGESSAAKSLWLCTRLYLLFQKKVRYFKLFLRINKVALLLRFIKSIIIEGHNLYIISSVYLLYLLQYSFLSKSVRFPIWIATSIHSWLIMLFSWECTSFSRMSSTTEKYCKNVSDLILILNFFQKHRNSFSEEVSILSWVSFGLGYE